MKHYLGPLVCALVAACSSNRQPAESAYDSTSDTDAELVPASSDAVDAATETPTPDVEPAPTADAPPTRSAPDTIPSPTDESRQTPTGDTPAAADNTKVNRRDTDGAAPTPIDQGNNASDLKTTQEIRKAVVGDGSLSFTAKNVKIITTGGKVTLRGPVKNAEEREKIAALARKIAGAANVDNQLEIVK
jgi:hyperosmotically inducible periplasmic protein